MESGGLFARTILQGAELAWSRNCIAKTCSVRRQIKLSHVLNFLLLGGRTTLERALTFLHLAYLWTLARPRFDSGQIWEQSPSVYTDNVTRRNIRLDGALRARAETQKTAHGHLLSCGCPTLLDVYTRRRRIAREPDRSDRVVDGCRFWTLCHIEDTR